MSKMSKITNKEIEKNMKRLNEAIGIGKLDNHSTLDAEYLNDLEEMVKGNLTLEELEAKIIAQYKKD